MAADDGSESRVFLDLEIALDQLVEMYLGAELLKLHREIWVRREVTVALTSAIWAELGSPSERERRTILKHLRRIPGVLRLEKRHRGYTRYQATKGDMWETK